VAYRLTAITLSVLLACGGDDGGETTPDAGDGNEDGSTGGSIPLTIDDLCGVDGAYVEFFNSAFECSGDFLDLLDLSFEATELDAACDELFAPYVEDGSIVLGTRDDLAACQDKLRNLDCAQDDIRTIRECDAVVRGTVAINDDCQVNGQCENDGWCDTSGSGSCGICRARKSDTSSCNDDDECEGRRCAGQSQGSAGTCRAVALDGMSCTEDDDCVGTLRCNPTSLRCEVAPAWAVDDACLPNTSDCGFPGTNLFCNEGTNTCATFAGIGDACAGGVGTCNFLEYQVCDENGTGLCTAPQTSPLAGACNMFLGQKCQAGLSCSQPFSGGTCVDPSVGSTCNAAVEDFSCGILLECKSDNTCNYEAVYTGTCP